MVALLGARRALLNLGPRIANAEAAAILARFSALGVPAPAQRRRDVDALVGALKVGGVWPKLDRLGVLAAHDPTAALVDWIDPARGFTAQGAPVFTTDRGYAGNGTSAYLDTGFVASTAGGVFVQDSAHLGIWSRTAAASATTGNGDVGNGNAFLNCRTSADQAAFRVNAGSSGLPASTDGSGLFVVSRTANNLTTLYRNGASLSTSGAASAALDANSIRMLGRSGTVQYAARECALFSIGAGLSAVDASAFYGAVAAYLGAVGAA